jgi:hypothetical protein
VWNWKGDLWRWRGGYRHINKKKKIDFAFLREEMVGRDEMKQEEH